MTADLNTGGMPALPPLPDDVAQCTADIDGIDRQIVDLLMARFRLSRRIGTLKAGLGAAPFDPRRIRQQTSAFVDACVHSGLDPVMATFLIQSVLHQVVAERLEVDPPRS